MNATYATVDPANYAKIDKGTVIEVRSTVRDDTNVVEGAFVSVNSKGINVKLDTGRVVSRSLRYVTNVALVVTTPDTPADLFADDATYTTAELAAALDMDAYDLRVILRELGLGVGKGRKYGFDRDEARKLYTAVKAHNA